MKKRKLIVPSFLLIIIVLLSLAMLPLKGQTAGDDYFYAYSVKKTIETGTIQIPEASTAASVFPIVWALIFSSLLGFSYETLHISTLIFLPVVLITSYYLLKQFKLDSHKAIFGSLFFISNPYFFQFAYTFLTDFPFLTLELLAILFFTLGLKNDRTKNLFIGSVFSTIAFLSRQLGLFFVAGALLATVLRRENIPIAKKIVRVFILLIVPVTTITFYVYFFKEGTVSQHNLGKTIGNSIDALLFLRSTQSGLSQWSRVIYVSLEFIWSAFGFFSLFTIAFILSNLKRYSSKKMILPLFVSLTLFTILVAFEKLVYMDKTFLGFPLVLYRYESFLPIPWAHVWKYLVMTSFVFVSMETLMNFKSFKITKSSLFLIISFVLVLAATAITPVNHKKYVLPLLPFFLIYIAYLSRRLRLSGLIAIPILLLVLVDSLQMAKLRYDTNALAQKKAMILVNNGISIDNVLPNLEYTWSLWYTIDDKYAQALKKAGGDKLKVKYPVTPDKQK